MAFLTTSDIASSLPAGYNSIAVDMLLVTAEIDLRLIGLIFDDEVATARSIESDLVGRSVFSITPIRSISTVNLKNIEGTTTRTLVLNSDYIRRPHRNITSYFTQIELINCPLYSHDTLEITGKWGIYIDFSASTNTETRLVKGAVIAWVNSMLEQYKADKTTAKNIQSSETGESQVSYFSRRLEDFSWSFSQSARFKTLLDWFYA